MITILGIDPALRKMGYGVIHSDDSLDLKDFEMIDCGVIHPNVKLSTKDRLFLIYKSVKELIDRFKPDEIAIEDQFLGRASFTSIAKVSMSKVPVMIQAAKHGIAYTEYSPRKVKAVLTGKYDAKKGEVEEALRLLIPLDDVPLTDDASDALAIACSHVLTLNEKAS